MLALTASESQDATTLLICLGSVFGGAAMTQAVVVVGLENPQRIPLWPVVRRHWKTCGLIILVKWVLAVALFFVGALMRRWLMPEVELSRAMLASMGAVSGLAPTVAAQSLRSVRRWRLVAKAKKTMAGQVSGESVADELSEVQKVLNHATEVFLVRMAQAIAADARLLMAEAYVKHTSEVFNLVWEKHLAQLEQDDGKKGYKAFRNPFQKASTLCRELGYKTFIVECNKAQKSLESKAINGMHETTFRNIVQDWDGVERRGRRRGTNLNRRRCDRLVNDPDGPTGSDSGQPGEALS